MQQEIEPETLNNIAIACQGLSLERIRRVLSKVIAKYGEIDASSPNLILQEKKQIIQQTQLLEFCLNDKNISDLNIVMRDFIMQRFPPPYFGVSHSMGGQINLRTAVLHKGLFHSIALSAPMIGPIEHSFQISLLKIVTSISELFLLGHRPLKSATTDRASGRSSYNRVTMDDRRFERNERIVDRHPYVNVAFKSYSWSVGAVNAMQKTLRKSFLSRLDIPVFIGIAEDEKLVSNLAIYKAIALSDYIEGKLYPDTRHELFMETDASRQVFLEDIDNHFMRVSGV